MKKEQLKTIFGNYVKAAKALGVTKGAITNWDTILDSHQVDRIRGAAVRLGVYNPDLFPQPNDKEVSNG
jgi:hypothetical protein